MRKYFVIAFSLALSLLRPTFADTPFLPNSTLSLQDCIAVAMTHNTDLIASEKKIHASLSRASAKTADYWPQISLESDYIRGNFIAVQGPTSSLLTSVFTTYIVRGSGNIVIEDFGERFAKVGEARAQLSQAEANYHDTRSRVIFEVAQAYFRLLEAQSIKHVTQDLLAATQNHLKLAQSFVEVGEKSKLELMRAQSSFSSAQYDDLKATQDMENAYAQLNQVMGIADPPSYQVKEDFVLPPFQLDLTTAKALAFKAKPELLVARGKVEEARATINKAKAQRWPTLSAEGDYGWFDPIFPPQTQSWSLGLTLNWSLFDGNRLTHQINEAVALEQSVEAEEQGVRLKVGNQVEKSYRDFTLSEERLQVARDEVRAAEESFRLAENRYKVGLTSLLELTDAQADFTRAKSHEVSALTDSRIAQSAMKRAIGIEMP